VGKLLTPSLCLQYGSFFLSYTFFGLMYATGQFPALVETGLPLEGLQFALLMYAFLSVIFIGLSFRMNFALTALFTCIALAYFCLGIGQTRDGVRVTKVRGRIMFNAMAWHGRVVAGHVKCSCKLFVLPTLMALFSVMWVLPGTV